MTYALHSDDMWARDNEMWGEGDEMQSACEKLGAAWKKLLANNTNDKLGIDEEFTRPKRQVGGAARGLREDARERRGRGGDVPVRLEAVKRT